MRDFKGIKRQRNRNRNGGGGKPQSNANRAFDSNGPDGVKVRGAAQHVYEKYQQLARDAQTSGDRVLAESYLQHAEHYFRVLRAMQPQRPVADIIGRDQIASGYDIDFEDESGQAETVDGEGEGGEGEAERAEGREDRNYRDQRSDWRGDDRGERGYRGPREDRYRDERPRDERQRDERSRDDRPRDDRPRDDRPRDERSRDDRSRDDRFRDERPRDDRFRDDRSRDGRGERRRYDRPERAERFERAEPIWRGEPEEERRVEAAGEAPVVGSGHVLRADDGQVSHAPAFLQTRAPVAERDADPAEAAPAEARRPRRRRPPRDFVDAGSVPEPEDA